MRYSLVFENQAEGYGSSYDLIFGPNPVWVQGDNLVLDLGTDNPILQPGSVQKLLEHEEITFVEKCILVVHSIGHGDIDSLELLKKDLENAEILYKIVDFRELS